MKRYEISFRTELDDRAVDHLADTLSDLGFDSICFRPLADHHSRADSTADRDALRAAIQHETARELKW